ncbi:hypothetical protein, partial [Flavonifractor plautii]
LLSPFEWWCRNFILPDICKPCLFVFLRNLFYLTLFFASPILRWKGRNLPAKEVEKSIFKSKQPVAC